MQNCKYYSDSRHNYLVIPCSSETGDYQYRMLAANRIKGLLEASIRSIDGETFLYYDITSRQSIAALYQDRKMDGEFIRNLLYAIAGTGEILSDYLLDASRILLHPEFMFYDLIREECCFVYFPEETEESSFRAVSEFLTDHVNAEEKAAAGVVLRLEELSSNPTFILDKAVLDKEYGDPGVEASREETERTELSYGDTAAEEKKRPAPSSVEIMKAELKRESEWPKTEYADDEDGSSEKDAKEIDKRRKISRVLILAVIFLLGAVGLEIYRRSGYLNNAYTGMVSTGEIAFLILAMATALCGTFITGKQNRLETEMEEAQEEEAVRNRVIPTSEYTASRMMKKPEIGYLMEEAAVYQVEETGPGKLYGVGDARSYRVDFADLPCTVGTLKGFCDVLIGDASISGLHVRFALSDKNEIEMTDLNSTAGTYLNGRRLLPNEAAIICRGDEVKIGRLEFCYR